MSLIIPANSLAVGGYNIDNSLRFNSASSDYLSRTYGTPTNNLKYTKSFWIKRSGLTDIAKGFIFNNSTNSNTDYFYFNASDQIVVGQSTSTPNTTAVFKDISAWYHCVMVFDSANATADDRLILYVNGIRQTLSSTISQNSTGGNQSGVTYEIGHQGTQSRYLDGYLAEIYMIDGQALTPTDFGEFDQDTGIWKPIKYTGTYGNNGFYLDFENSGSLGADQSGNGNNWTVNNLTSIDQVTDTPTNNFATMNPLVKAYPNGTTSYTFSEGNLNLTSGVAGYSGYSSFAIPKQGKWYFEHRQNDNPILDYPQIGITETTYGGASALIGFHTTSGSDYRGKIYSSVNSGVWNSARSSGDVFGWYLDFDNNKMIVHKNGSTYMSGSYLSGYDFSSRTLPSGAIDIGFWTICCMTDDTINVSFNFGNPTFTISSGNSDANGYGNFEYSPTLSGVNYYSLCTKNLAEFG